MEARKHKNNILHLQNTDTPDLSISTSSLSKDGLLIKNFIQPIKEYLDSIGVSIDNIKPFSFVLKDFSHKNMTPKGEIFYGHVKKPDFVELMKFIYNNTSDILLSEYRSYGRAAYEIKDLVLTYCAIKYPDLMREIAYNLDKFTFGKKLMYNKKKVAEKLVEYVKELQKIENPQISINLNDLGYLKDDGMEICFSEDEIDDIFNIAQINQNDANSEDDMYGNEYFH